MTAIQPRTREAVLKIAAWQLGVLESPAGSNAVKYNEAFYGRRVAGSAYPWCVTFVWWVFREAGFFLAKTAVSARVTRLFTLRSAARRFWNRSLIPFPPFRPPGRRAPCSP